MKLDDIDWKEGRIKITSPKTEHHAGKETWLVPLFPELRPYLEEASEACPMERCMWSSDTGKARWDPKAAGLKPQKLEFERIIKRAGLEPWPRLFHNLCVSRETELAEQFPIHVVATWLGNTPEIARKHYLQTTDEHFQRALESAPRTPPTAKAVHLLLHHIAAKSGAVSCRKRQ